LPPPSPPKEGGRGKPRLYTDRLFLKALVIMIVKRLSTAYELLSVLDQPTSEMQTLRSLLFESGRFPCRRTFERRLAALPSTLPARIGSLGRSLVALLNPWKEQGRAVACDSTCLRAKGGVWHKKDRERGEVPHTSIDTEAAWTKSGWHGWVYGWKLHLAMTVSSVWIPLAAALTPANADDGETAPELLRELPDEVRFVLGDRHYNRDDLRERCAERDRELVASRYGKYPHTDDGVEVRRAFHKLRSVANENFNHLFKGIFDGHDKVPTKGLKKTQLWALGAIFVYQLALWYRYEHGLDLRVGLKPFLKAA
jgi:IS5 family transposase